MWFVCFFVFNLNSSTIDELGEGAWIVEPQAQEQCVYGNHDDPVSGSHQARSHQKNSGTSLPDTYPREGGRVGSEVAKHN